MTANLKLKLRGDGLNTIELHRSVEDFAVLPLTRRIRVDGKLYTIKDIVFDVTRNQSSVMLEPRVFNTYRTIPNRNQRAFRREEDNRRNAAYDAMSAFSATLVANGWTIVGGTPTAEATA